MIDSLVQRSLQGVVPVVVLIAGLLAGLFALQFTPREEEPQIVVPMVVVQASASGLSARQVERQVTVPLENLLSQIPGVENIYSVSHTSMSEVTLRFYVGEDREDALLNTYNKILSNQNVMPPVVQNWWLDPVEVDDVPIVLLGLWSDRPDQYSDVELRRVADELVSYLQATPDTSEVNVIGGRHRQINVNLDPEAMVARLTTVQDIASAISVSNRLVSVGDLDIQNQNIQMESGDYFRSVDELSNSLVSVIDGIPVKLKDVAEVVDSHEVATSYQWIEFGPGHELNDEERAVQVQRPMVTISVAKQRGTNAVSVAKNIHAVIADLDQTIIPDGMHIETLRDYGVTADEKVNNLISSLLFAVLTVVVFLGIFLDWRAALVVAIAVPLCYGFTLLLDYSLGYTINRVTLFALILSLGLLVDDPITGVDNIERFLRETTGDINVQIVNAMSEIKIALIVSTLTIVLAFVPLAFITGMMGPYMAPMAFNVPVSVIASTVVAFLVTPWLAKKLLKPAVATTGGPALLPLYQGLLKPLIASRLRARRVLWIVLLLFIIAALLPMFRQVPLKLLPFDNKNEIQLLVDMPEGATLEATAAEAKRVSDLAQRLPEVKAVAVFVGEPSPNDFNGMVRRYDMRKAPYLADIRLTLVNKDERVHASHAVVLRLRELLDQTDLSANIKVVEVPPGPPVMDTLVAEIYGTPLTDYSTLIEASKKVRERLELEPYVVQIDTTVQHPQPLLRFVTDREKAALSGVSVDDVNRLLGTVNAGSTVSYMHFPREAHPLPINLRLPARQRSSVEDLLRLQVTSQQDLRKLSGANGLDREVKPLVALAELGKIEPGQVDQSIFHKDLNPVVYVTAELSGRTPAEVIADIYSDYVPDGDDIGEYFNTEMSSTSVEPNSWQGRTYFNSGGGSHWSLPEGVEAVWGGEGEWRITVRVFRDMGLGFLFALLAIFAILSLQTGSASLSLIIMSAIPLSIIGIMPGFFLLNQLGDGMIGSAPDPVLFTATAMIGMIALAGIVVRNSLILVEFIEQARKAGVELREALYNAGAVRMRPIMLTAGTTLLGNLIITQDPVFNGLALAIIFGILSSTIFTLVVVPVVYFLVFESTSRVDGS